MKRLAGMVVALVLSAGALAQERPVRPLDVPMSFSGTYGELRHDHFHGGLDWRVGGQVGDPIHAVKSGYVSRVSVSPWGYGNGLYLTHPDGTTSVYGHMLSFRDDIAERVEAAQYAQESFSVNLTFDPDEFPVAQGDVIGRVGNTGSSAGPHLHMEIRDTEKDMPLNYLSGGYYKPLDQSAPQFHRVCFYGLDDSPIPVAWRVYNLVKPTEVRDTLRLPARSYVAVDATDRQEGTGAKLAVEEYRVLLDDTLRFSFRVGDIGFAEGRYIKSLIEYGESRRGGRDLVKSRVDPNNLLASHITCVDDGIFTLADDAVHTVRIEVLDEHGNKAAVRYKVQRDDTLEAPQPDTSLTRIPWLWYTQNMVCDSSLAYYLPAGALYNNIDFPYRYIGGPDPARGIWSDIWQVGDPDIPLQLPGALEITADIPEELDGKAYMANYGKTLSYAGVNVRFGTYCVAVDTTAPEIRFLDRKGDIVNGSTIRIRVRDNASGVESTRVEIDGKWYLAMYKRDIISLELKENRLERGKHAITVTATDLCGNEAHETRTFSF